MNFRIVCSHAVGWRINAENLEFRVHFLQWTAQMVNFRKMTRIRVIIRHPMFLHHPLGREAGIICGRSEASTYSQQSIQSTPANVKMNFVWSTSILIKMRARLFRPTAVLSSVFDPLHAARPERPYLRPLALARGSTVQRRSTLSIGCRSHHVATPLHLATCLPSTWPPTSTTTTISRSMASLSEGSAAKLI